MLYFVLPICYQFWYARKYTSVQHLPGKQLFAPLAQLAEQVTLNHWVAGSIPARCTLFESLNSGRRQVFRIFSTWSCANPSRIVSFPLIVTVLAAYSAS